MLYCLASPGDAGSLVCQNETKELKRSPISTPPSGKPAARVALRTFLLLQRSFCDTGAIRRSAALAEGWPVHAAALRRAAAEGGAAPPLVALLYFLGLDAQDGRLEIAYEGDDRRRYPAGLGEPPGGTAGPRDGPGWSYEFTLA